MEPSAFKAADAKLKPLKYSTRFYIECEIAKELHLSLEAYHRLSLRERKTWYLHKILAAEKERYAHEEARRDAEVRQPRRTSRPSKYRD